MSKSRALTKEELKVCRQLIGLDTHSVRNLVLFELLVNSLRVGEACKLRNSDLLNEDGTIKDELVIHSTMTKSKASHRVPLSKRAKEAISQYIQIKKNLNWRDYPFLESQKSLSAPLTSNSAQQIIKKVFKTAKIDNSSHFGRKTFAKFCYENNIHPLACSSIMGHQDPSLTMKFYQEASAGSQKRVIDQLNL